MNLALAIVLAIGSAAYAAQGRYWLATIGAALALLNAAIWAVKDAEKSPLTRTKG